LAGLGDLYSRTIFQNCMDTRRIASMLFSAIADGRHVARVTFRRCGHAADIDPKAFRGLYGATFVKRLKCRQCGACDASVWVPAGISAALPAAVLSDQKRLRAVMITRAP
jgi:hypothetical protein